jgi:hypothetical protein
MESNENQPAPLPPVSEPTPKPTYGGVVALIIIVAIIAFGAFYLLDTRLGGSEAPEEAETIDALGEQSDATDTASIETDLEAQTPEDFDRELDDAFKELDAAFE